LKIYNCVIDFFPEFLFADPDFFNKGQLAKETWET